MSQRVQQGLLQDSDRACQPSNQPVVGSAPSETALFLIQQSLTHCWQEAKAQRFGSRLSTAGKKSAAPAQSGMRSEDVQMGGIWDLLSEFTVLAQRKTHSYPGNKTYF